MYFSVTIRGNLLAWSLKKPDVRHVNLFEKRRRLTVFAASSKRGGARRDAGGSRFLLRDPRCSPAPLASFSRKGCGGRDARDTKRAETLSRNRNQAAWSLRSASFRGGRGRLRVGRDECVAHASRLHRGIRWLGSSRDPRGGFSLLPPIPPFPEERSGILQNSSTLPRSPRSTARLSRSPRIRYLLIIANLYYMI